MRLPLSAPTIEPHRRWRAQRLGTLLHRWHRRIGVVASVFLIWLAVSGIALNETTLLGLDHLRIGWPWLMRWYGLGDSAPPREGFSIDTPGAGNHWLVAGTDTAVLDGQLIDPPIHSPLGAVAGGDAAHPLLSVVTADSLVLLTTQGVRVDELRSPPLPTGAISRIGSGEGGDIVIQMSSGEIFRSSDGESWAQLASPASADIRWSSPGPLPAVSIAAAAHALRPSLPATRVLADAHSGRALGRLGPRIIDLAGLAAVLLAGSGLWMVLRKSRHSQGRH